MATTPIIVSDRHYHVLLQLDSQIKIVSSTLREISKQADAAIVSISQGFRCPESSWITGPALKLAEQQAVMQTLIDTAIVLGVDQEVVQGVASGQINTSLISIGTDEEAAR